MHAIPRRAISRQKHHRRHQFRKEMPTKTKISHTRLGGKIRESIIDKLEAPNKAKDLMWYKEDRGLFKKIDRDRDAGRKNIGLELTPGDTVRAFMRQAWLPV